MKVFKNAFAVVMGIYAGCVAINLIDDIKKRLKGTETSKEES